MSPPSRSPSVNGHESPPPPAASPHMPFVRRTVAALAVVAAAGVLLALLLLGIDIWLAAFGGILFAVLLRAATTLLASYTGLPQRWAYACVLVLLAGAVVLVAVLFAPIVEDQAQAARQQLPEMAADIEEFLEERGWGRWLLEKAHRAGEDAQGTLADFGELFDVFTNWFYYFLTGFFVGIFAAAQPALYVQGVAQLVPIPKRERVVEALHELGYTLRWWLVGQLLAMLVIGVSTGLLLWAFGVPLAALIGLIVGLLGFIPYLGPIIGMIPVSLAAAMKGVETLGLVLLAYVAVQIFEGYVVTPLIQHRMVYLPPVMTIISQILLGSLVGALGFVLATPLAAVLLVLSRFYREDVLGESGAVEKGHQH